MKSGIRPTVSGLLVALALVFATKIAVSKEAAKA